jgi:hypothetical protein
MSFAMRLPCLLLVCSLAAMSRAQKHEPGSATDAQLLADLGNDERCVEAVRTLTHRGEKGVTILMAAIGDTQFHADERRLAVAIYALGKLGDLAVPAVPLLLDELAAVPRGNVLLNLYWAIGEIGPKAQADGTDMLGALLSLQPHNVAEGWEWSFAYERIALGVAADKDVMKQWLRTRSLAHMAAVGWLMCRQAPDSSLPLEDLRAAWRFTEQDVQHHDETYPRVIMDLARAVSLHLPDTSDGTAARATLIYHYDVDVRLQAVMQLGQSPADDREMAVKALQISLTDGSLQIRREAVTALGMIGPPAADALPALQALAQDPDLQVRARAAAAVRAIGRNGK